MVTFALLSLAAVAVGSGGLLAFNLGDSAARSRVIARRLATVGLATACLASAALPQAAMARGSSHGSHHSHK